LIHLCRHVETLPLDCDLFRATPWCWRGAVTAFLLVRWPIAAAPPPNHDCKEHRTMPAPTMTIARHYAVVAMLLAAASPSALAQTRPLPSVEATPTTPPQREALAIFQPQVEQLCRALYLRSDAAEDCLQRVLDAALPLDVAPAVTPPQAGHPRSEHRGSTVAPDGRE
jgi:hypothetical protein